MTTGFLPINDSSLNEKFGGTCNNNAYGLLNKYKDKVCCFYGIAEGIGVVSLAGFYASTGITNIPFSDLRIMFLGAGSAATDSAGLVVSVFVEEVLSEKVALMVWECKRVVSNREDMLPHPTLCT